MPRKSVNIGRAYRVYGSLQPKEARRFALEIGAGFLVLTGGIGINAPHFLVPTL